MNNTITEALTTHITNQLQQHQYLIVHSLTGKIAVKGQHYSRIQARKFKTINLIKHILILIYPDATETDINIKILAEHSITKNNKIHHQPPIKLTLYTQAKNPDLLEQIEQQIKQ